MRILKKNISLTLILAIVFIHFTPVSILGFPLTLAPFAILLFFLTHFKLSIRRNGMYLFMVLIMTPIITYGAFTMSEGWVEFSKFITTYLLWVYAVLCMVLFLFGRPRITTDYSTESIIALLIVVLFSDFRVPGNHRLLLFDQKDSYHGGLGFLINNRELHFFRSLHQISDRVVYMDFFVLFKSVHQPPL